MASYRVRVPATSANIGPGFDCLGLALDLHLEVECRPAERFSLELVGEGADTLPRDPSNLVVRALLSATGASDVPSVALRVVNPIALERGMGSSAAAAIAGLAIGELLAGRTPDRVRLLARATAIEGHADNAAAAIYGGLVVCGVDPPFAIVESWPPELALCVVVPELRISTEKARAALPTSLPFADAVATSTRLAQLLVALRARRFELLRSALDDRIHQPYRLRLGRGLAETLAVMGEHPASCGAWLSGSGPTLMATSLEDVDAVGRAGVERFAALGIDARHQVLAVDEAGLSYESLSEESIG